MPLLAAEPEQFPGDLLAGPGPDSAVGREWWALHTRARQEKCLARQLREASISYYLPQITRRWRLRGRTLTSYVPLFSGYVFLFGSREERLAALVTNRVVHCLEVPDQAGLWCDLRQIHQLIASGAPITPEERLVPGSYVEIRSGPLAGLRGKILGSASRRRFVVQVNFIQRGASVLMDDFNLVKIEADCVLP